MNFAKEIKKEILSRPIKNEEGKKAYLSGLIRGNGILYELDGEIGFEFKTDSEESASLASEFFRDIYGYEIREITFSEDKRHGKDRIKLNVFGDLSERIIEDLGIIEEKEGEKTVNFNVFSDKTQTENYLKNFFKGLFVSVGSCVLPSDNNSENTGYHLEFAFSRSVSASEISGKLEKVGIKNKITRRKEKFIVYIKSAEEIKNFVAFIGCVSSVFKITEIMIEREIKNTSNRQKNCDLGNLTKQVEASSKQTEAIKKIKKTCGIDSLKPSLREIAEARLNSPEETLSELAEKLKITKSCLNHRLRKIIEIANEL